MEKRNSHTYLSVTKNRFGKEFVARQGLLLEQRDQHFRRFGQLAVDGKRIGADGLSKIEGSRGRVHNLRCLSSQTEQYC
jgi:hypothetical protein